MRRLLIGVALLAALSGPARGRDQDIRIGRPWSVTDSLEVLTLTEKARKAASAGNHERAALKVQQILDFYPNHVVQLGSAREARFIGARLWVHQFLESLPPEGREAYRTVSGPEARQLLERATRSREEALLLEVIRRFYLSGVGPDALRAQATLLLTQGRYADASHYLWRLRYDFPAETSAEDLARLAFALAKNGDLPGFMRLIDLRPDLVTSRTPIEVGGEPVPLLDFVIPLAKEVEVRAAESLAADASWPVYGGSSARDRPAPSISGVGPVQWMHQTNLLDKENDYEDQSFRWRDPATDLLRDDHFPIHPVIDRGVVYFQNGSAVFAVNLYTGKLLWIFRGPWAFALGKTNPGSILGLAVAKGVVYANLEIEAPYVSDQARKYANKTVIYYIPQRRLFAIEAATGKVLWSHENSQIRDADRNVLENLNVNSPPLVVEDTLYVTASRQVGRYFSYLLAVDARTGKVRWRTRLCTGQQELNLFGRPIKELAGGAVSEKDGILYCSTNLGVAVALDRRTGEIIWIKGYPQLAIPFSVRWYTTEERRPTWANTPPIVTDDTVYFTPTDSYDLIALARTDGSLRFRYPIGEDGWMIDEPRYLIGVGPEYVYAAGPRVIAIHRKTGKVAWPATRGAFRNRTSSGDKEAARGRGLLTPEAVYTMTVAGLYSFDPKTGKRLSFKPLKRRAGPAKDRLRRSGAIRGGNLIVAGHVLLVASREEIAGYYLWERIYDDLKRKAAEEPDNPHLALEVGEVYSQGKRLDEAAEAFSRALRLSKRLSGKEGEDVAHAARKGLFDVHMLQGARQWEDGDRNAAARHYRAALNAAVDDRGRIRAHLALANHYRFAGKLKSLAATYTKIEESHGQVMYEFLAEGLLPAGLYALLNLADLELDAGRPERAIGHLSRIILDYPRRELLTNTESHIFAREKIDRILAEHGREVYEPLEKKAQALLKAAREEGSAEALEEVTRLYPNSAAVEEASVALGRLLLMKGDYRKASIALRRNLSEFPKSRAAPTVLYLLARALEKRGFLVSAKSALARLARRYPESVIEVGGEKVAAGLYASRRLLEEQYQALVSQEVRLGLPLDLLWLMDEGEASYVRVLETEGIPPAGFEGNLLLGTNGLLRAVDSRSQRVLWQREMNGIVTKPAFVEGLLVLVNTTSISAVDPDTGKQRWEILNEASVRAVRANPGTVYVLTADFQDPTNITLRAIAPRTGEIIWQKEILDHQVYDLLLITEETVAIAARQPTGVTVFDAATGRLRFRVEMAPRTLYREPFLVDEDKLFVVHGNQRIELHDMSTGLRLWETNLPEDRYFRSAIPVAGGIFVTDTQEHLMLIEAATGEVRFTVPASREAPLQYQGEASDAERVYVVRRRESDNMYQAEARDLRTGEILWRAELLTSKSATPTPMLTNRHVIFHVNSYDFGQNAWVSTSLFLDKETGERIQEIAPEELQGFFTYAFLAEGIFSLNARGRVAVYGSR